ncbi:MAG: hypothetical protein M1838_001093 [Thelocarpon superellum]|nr:MAG: hypothetical protein M1838_001093 [Thelocarpon superellum]
MYPKTAPFRDSRSPQRTGSEPTDADVLTQALEFTRRPPPPLGSIPPLRRPIAIPQVTGGIGQPYIRAWAPELESHGISEKEFVEFVDNLNVVTTSNPPLQVLDLVGGVIGFVPYHWAMIAGIAIQATAKLGKAAVSKGRTEMYMTKVNTAFFAPRRLQARIASGDAMAAALHLPPSMPLLAPLTQQNIHMTSQERVIAAVQPYMSFVTLNVPPPTSQTTMLAKMSAKQVEIQTKRREHKVMKQRMKHGIPGSADGPRNGNWSEKMMRLDEKAVEIEQQGGLDHRQQRKLDKLDRKMDKLERKSERKSGKGDKKDKEAKGAQKSLWILIENLD